MFDLTDPVPKLRILGTPFLVEEDPDLVAWEHITDADSRALETEIGEWVRKYVDPEGFSGADSEVTEFSIRLSMLTDKEVQEDYTTC